jgi:hypothetical protein
VQSLHRCRPPVLLHKKLRESRNKTLKITKGEREFRACWAVVFGRFLGVLILVPGVWILGVASQGVASPGYCWSRSLLVVVLEVLD